MTDSPCRRTSFTCSRIVSTASSALTLVKPVSSAIRLTISTFLMRPSRSHHADVAVIHTEWRKGVAHFRVASNNRLICISLTHLVLRTAITPPGAAHGNYPRHTGGVYCPPQVPPVWRGGSPCVLCVSRDLQPAAYLLRTVRRRFLQKNLPRCGPRRCGQTPRLPPAGGGPIPPHEVGGRRSGVETRGEPFPEITLKLNT